MKCDKNGKLRRLELAEAISITEINKIYFRFY